MIVHEAQCIIVTLQKQFKRVFLLFKQVIFTFGRLANVWFTPLDISIISSSFLNLSLSWINLI